MFKVKVLTLFPDMFPGPLAHSITGRGLKNELWSCESVDIRAFANTKYKKADDEPYGGGAGMVMKPELISMAIKSAKEDMPNAPVVFLTPTGSVFKQEKAVELSKNEDGIILLCGHYEGVDQRVIDLYVDYELSIGDYVLTGGEIAAYTVLDAILRNISNVLGNHETLHEESFDNGLLEYPHYTRPAEFEGLKVPEVLTSGHHGKVAQWRLDKSLEKTQKVRPDLYKKYQESKNK